MTTLWSLVALQVVGVPAMVIQKSFWRPLFSVLHTLTDIAWNISTLRCCHGAVNVLQYFHEGYPMARPSGRAIGYLLWDQSLIDVLSHFLQWCMQCHVILDCAMTALDCIYTWLDKTCLLSRYKTNLKITHHSLTVIMCCPSGWNRRQ